MNTWKYWKNDMGICAVGPDGRNPVARVFDEGGQGERVAALISAAPELLDALEHLASEAWQLRTGNVKKDYHLLVAHSAAIKAIRKAKGEV